MGGLPDVNTENQGFQEYYLKYCNDLISLGCDGFRYDTANIKVCQVILRIHLILEE